MQGDIGVFQHHTFQLLMIYYQMSMVKKLNIILSVNHSIKMSFLKMKIRLSNINNNLYLMRQSPPPESVARTFREEFGDTFDQILV